MKALYIGRFTKHVFKIIIGVLRVVLHNKFNCYSCKLSIFI